MSCNGCRVLRKGCSENCILRPCLQWIESPESQGHATVFVAKFFGRAGLMSFISSVPDSQRSALFRSLLFEAAGRTVNPVNGAVGLLWAGNWNLCQAAVDTVLRGGTLRSIPELLNTAGPSPMLASDDSSEVACTDNLWKLHGDEILNSNPSHHCRFSSSRSRAFLKRKRTESSPATEMNPSEPDLHLKISLPSERRRLGSPSMISEEESVTTTVTNNISCFERENGGGGERKLLNLFL